MIQRINFAVYGHIQLPRDFARCCSPLSTRIDLNKEVILAYFNPSDLYFIMGIAWMIWRNRIFELYNLKGHIHFFHNVKRDRNTINNCH
jgi:hypothetical protein